MNSAPPRAEQCDDRAAGHADASKAQTEQEKQDCRERITIGERTYRLEVAADTESRAKGLMGREKIKDDGGMLFIYPDVKRRSFWMKNCIVDIDLIFLDHRGRIVALHEMKAERPRHPREPEWQYERRLKRYTSRRPAQFAIELQAGMIRKLELETGQVIELDLKRLKQLAIKSVDQK